jgi:hypothetical protein
VDADAGLGVDLQGRDALRGQGQALEAAEVEDGDDAVGLADGERRLDPGADRGVGGGVDVVLDPAGGDLPVELARADADEAADVAAADRGRARVVELAAGEQRAQLGDGVGAQREGGGRAVGAGAGRAAQRVGVGVVLLLDAVGVGDLDGLVAVADDAGRVDVGDAPAHGGGGRPLLGRHRRDGAVEVRAGVGGLDVLGDDEVDQAIVLGRQRGAGLGDDVEAAGGRAAGEEEQERGEDEGGADGGAGEQEDARAAPARHRCRLFESAPELVHVAVERIVVVHGRVASVTAS